MATVVNQFSEETIESAEADHYDYFGYHTNYGYTDTKNRTDTNKIWVVLGRISVEINKKEDTVTLHAGPISETVKVGDC